MMRIAGMFLFLFGFLAGAFYIVREVNSVNWMHYGGAVAVSVVGVVLLRLAARGTGADEAEVSASMQRVVDCLELALERITALNAEREAVGVYGVHARIDGDVMQHVNGFVIVRETIIDVHGLETYAQTMDAFAAGERALNRAWSASADGYIDEVWICLERSQRKMTAALDVLRSAKAA